MCNRWGANFVAMPKPSSLIGALKRAKASRDKRHYVLRLYITGTTANSAKAMVNIRKLCEEYLKDRYDLEIVDISRRPNLAAREQILAAPTLIKKLPLPLRRFIGDLSQTQRILLALDVRPLSPGESIA